MPGVIVKQVDEPVNLGSTTPPATPPVGSVATYVENGVYYQKDSSGQAQRLDSVNVGPTAPLSPSEGLLWLDTSVNPNRMKTYQNGDWRDMYLYDSSSDQIAYDGGSF